MYSSKSPDTYIAHISSKKINEKLTSPTPLDPIPVEKEDDKDKEDRREKRKRSREKRLFWIIAILVVSWLIVKVWSDIFETFIRNVLHIKKQWFLPNLFVAVIFTIIIVSLLYFMEVDDMLR